MNAVDRDALRMAAEKATPGPWRWWGDEIAGLGAGVVIVEADWAEGDDSAFPVLRIRDPDAEFIVLARSAVPALLDALAAAEARADRAEKAISEALEHASQTHPDYDNAAATYQVLAASGRSPRSAPTRGDRVAVARVLKATRMKWSGPAMQEFANDPPTRKDFAQADAVLALLTAVGQDTPEPEWTDPEPWWHARRKRRYAFQQLPDGIPLFEYWPRTRAQYDAEKGT